MKVHELLSASLITALALFATSTQDPGRCSGGWGPSQELVEVLAELEEEVPLGYPVLLGIGTEEPGNWGESWWDDELGAYRIQIARGHPVIQRDTLLHEYAHCRVWETETGHGPFWGVAYAEAYRAIED